MTAEKCKISLSTISALTLHFDGLKQTFIDRWNAVVLLFWKDSQIAVSVWYLSYMQEKTQYMSDQILIHICFSGHICPPIQNKFVPQELDKHSGASSSLPGSSRLRAAQRHGCVPASS